MGCEGARGESEGRGAGDEQFAGKAEEKPEKAVEVEGVAAAKEADFLFPRTMLMLFIIHPH